MLNVKSRVRVWVVQKQNQIQKTKIEWTQKTAHIVCRYVTVNGFGRSQLGRWAIIKLVSLLEMLSPILAVIALGPTTSSINVSQKLLTVARASGSQVMVSCSSQRDLL